MLSRKFRMAGLFTALFMIVLSACSTNAQEINMKGNVYQFEAVDINGKTVSLSEFKGKLILVVNVASKCGFTSQYKGLEALYKKYKDRGLVIIGFPCNQFGAQEKGTEAEIKTFCELNYGVTFPMFSKIDVNGEAAHPLYKYLTKNAPGFITDGIKWNFTKFLVGKDGVVIDRYSPQTTPESLEEDIEKALK